jgi:aspartyl-tRNA(Asn)/glutamyl-tRNA(Gln) amidotransferase subunit B
LDSENILVDLNRAGVGLIEIVSEPEIESASDAANLVSKINDLLQDTKVCSGLLEQGALRVDVNVNWIDSQSKQKMTPRVELKNVNGIKIIEDAILAELERQKRTPLSELEEETRLYLPASQKTVLLRKKDGAARYRYLPEYDVHTLPVTASLIDLVRSAMPKTRQQLITEWSAQHPQHKPDFLLRLWSHPSLPSIFAELLKEKSLNPEFILNWMVGDMLGVLNRYPGAKFNITARCCSKLLHLLQSNQIDKIQAKGILFDAIKMDFDLTIPEIPTTPQNALDLDLDKEIDFLFDAHSDRVKFLQTQTSLRRGAFDFFIGRILKKHRGKVSVDTITAHLQRKLSNKPAP